MAATSFDEGFVERAIAALHEVGLEAIVVGGVAAVLHGAPVTTLDLDLLVRRNRTNEGKITRFRALMGGLGRVKMLEDVHALVGGEGTVDLIFNALPGELRFESVRSRAIDVRIGNVIVRVASLEDVIASKRAANRPKDRATLPMLESTLAVHSKLAPPTRRRPKPRKAKRR